MSCSFKCHSFGIFQGIPFDDCLSFLVISQMITVTKRGPINSYTISNHSFFHSWAICSPFLLSKMLGQLGLPATYLQSSLACLPSTSIKAKQSTIVFFSFFLRIIPWLLVTFAPLSPQQTIAFLKALLLTLQASIWHMKCHIPVLYTTNSSLST